jgi:hypothetical protein
MKSGGSACNFVRRDTKEKNRIDFNLILCPNHNLERGIITKMRNISSLNIAIMGKYRSTKVGEDITSDQDSAINHFVSKTLSFIGFNDTYNKNLGFERDIGAKERG